MTSWLGNVNGLCANLRHKPELAKYDFLATFFIYNEMNAICVGLLASNSFCIQFCNELLIAGTVQDVMPLVLHFIEQSNHSACCFFPSTNNYIYTYWWLPIFRTIHYMFCMRVYTLYFQLGSKDGKINSWQLYQTSSRACYAKSVSQMSSQLASF